MNNRAYHLLRNNKEEGPFTAEEIIDKNLRPYDLIWIDGKSAAWSYPGELAEFKMYAPLPVEVNQQQNKSFVSASIQAAMAVNNTIAKADSKQKPRYKVYAAWNQIPTSNSSANKPPMISESQKAVLKNTATSIDTQAKSLSWTEAWQDWENEKISLPKENYSNELPENTTAKKVNVSSPPLPETKLEQSHDKLNNHSYENVIRQKQLQQNNSFSGKLSGFIIPAFVLAIIFSISYWLLHDYGATSKTFAQSHTQQLKATTVMNDPAYSSTKDNALNESEKNLNRNKQTVANLPDRAEERKSLEHTNELNHQKNNSNSKESEVVLSKPVVTNTNYISSVKQPDLTKNISVLQDQQKAANPGDGDLKNNDASEQTNTVQDGSSINVNEKIPATIIKPEIKKTVSDYITTPEYIPMKNGIANIKIQNISDVNLDLVVIDVQYFDAAHNYRKGETMYLHNLKAGKNIVIKTPKDNDAYFATSKVSLISSDSGNVNVISDN